MIYVHYLWIWLIKESFLCVYVYVCSRKVNFAEIHFGQFIETETESHIQTESKRENER